ncbi:MAG: AzlD domain-containing protein [Lachnospiraceae bacterium]|nr:AzlD domain-containing protein [Lachnospiraceae bacterium]
MNDLRHAAALVSVMSIGTVFLRFLPFLVFKKKVPSYIGYLGKVLPPAIIGMLVVYCLRNTAISSSPFGIPELISIIAIAILQAWKRNSLISILSGTAIYMILISICI